MPPHLAGITCPLLLCVKSYQLRAPQKGFMGIVVKLLMTFNCFADELSKFYNFFRSVNDCKWNCNVPECLHRKIISMDWKKKTKQTPKNKNNIHWLTYFTLLFSSWEQHNTFVVYRFRYSDLHPPETQYLTVKILTCGIIRSSFIYIICSTLTAL